MIPMTGESPTLPAILFLIPPVDVAHATLPEQSTATAPTVSWALECKKKINPQSISLSATNLFRVLTSRKRRITDSNSVPNISITGMNTGHKGTKAKEEAATQYRDHQTHIVSQC